MARERKGKIDSNGLGPRVLDLHFKDHETPTAIQRILRAEGHIISQPTIARWLDKEKEKNGDEVQEILHNHQVKELPKDLNALEEFQALTREWALDEPEQVIDKVSKQERALAAIPRWRHMILNALDEKAQGAAAREIITEALTMVMEYFDDKKRRLSFMKLSMMGIGMKLQHSSVIDSDRSGNIYITTNAHPQDGPKKPGEKPGRKGAVIPLHGSLNAG